MGPPMIARCLLAATPILVIALSLALSLALPACSPPPRFPPGWRPPPIALPPPGPPQLTGRSPSRLLEDEVSELRKMVEDLRPIDYAYPEILERFAVALLELSDQRREAAIALDPRVRALPPPQDRGRPPGAPPRAGATDTDVDGPVDRSAEPAGEVMFTVDLRPVYLAPPRDFAALAALDPRARSTLGVADRLAAEAVATLRTLADSPRARERPLDRILFELASAEDDLGQWTRARATYQRLIKQFPESRYLPQAWIAFGHHFADALDLDDAATCFEKALALSRGKAGAIAAHRLALVRHEQKRPDEAWAALGQAALLAGDRAPAVLAAICADAKALRPGVALEGCSP